MNFILGGGKRMICPKCGGDTFIMVSDVGLKCENCGYIYSKEGKKWMKFVWLVQERGATVAVCSSEATANKVIKHYPERELQKRKDSIVADVVGDRFYYYH